MPVASHWEIEDNIQNAPFLSPSFSLFPSEGNWEIEIEDNSRTHHSLALILSVPSEVKGRSHPLPTVIANIFGWGSSNTTPISTGQ
jgi:hypothetical protein